MSDKKPTQAMPDDGRAGAPDGTNQPDTADPGAGGGGRLRPDRSEQRGGFRGGQSQPAYHGSHQLGEQPTDDADNPNAAARSN